MLSPDAALKILRATPMKQITMAKEVVQLIGKIETKEAYLLLKEHYRRVILFQLVSLLVEPPRHFVRSLI